MNNPSSDPLDWSGGLQLTAGPYFLGLYQPSPETRGFWEGVKRRELLLKCCGHCNIAYHPKRIVCTQCGDNSLNWKQSSGRGKVFSFSEVHHVADPAFKSSVPYTVGLIRLDEGVHLMSRLIAEPGPICIDESASVDFRVLELGHLLPVFLIGKQ